MSIRLLHISDSNERGPTEKYEDDSRNINYLSTINPVHHPNSEIPKFQNSAFIKVEFNTRCADSLAKTERLPDTNLCKPEKSPQTRWRQNYMDIRFIFT